MGLSVSENVTEVMERLRSAARKAGREPSEITLVAVTKSVDVKEIREAISGGLRVFGENYIQEAREKVKKIRDKTKKWHFIGHLQKNKAKYAVELFDAIHTVDSVELAKELNKRAKKPIDILIQVNISGEKTKSGIKPVELLKLVREVSGFENLRLKGLMTMSPYLDSPELSRPYYITLRRLAERVNRERIPGVFLHDLSMGMSNDYAVAIEEGATMVRVGTAIFGPRVVEKPEKKEAAAPVKKAPKAERPKAGEKPAKKTSKKTAKKAGPRPR